MKEASEVLNYCMKSAFIFQNEKELEKYNVLKIFEP